MTTVWILWQDEGPYTNPLLIAVYATEDAARAALEKHKDDSDFLVASEDVLDQ